MRATPTRSTLCPTTNSVSVIHWYDLSGLFKVNRFGKIMCNFLLVNFGRILYRFCMTWLAHCRVQTMLISPPPLPHCHWTLPRAMIPANMSPTSLKLYRLEADSMGLIFVDVYIAGGLCKTQYAEPQEAQLLQRGRAMLCVVVSLKILLSLKVTQGHSKLYRWAGRV